MLWVISYDIADARRRRLVSRELQGVGQRVQKSVFECRISPSRMNALRADLLEIINPQQDSVRYYSLCRWCVDEVSGHGTVVRIDSSEYYLV